MYSNIRSPTRHLNSLGESRSAKKNFDSPNPTHLDSTQLQLTPHLRSHSQKKYSGSSPSFLASQSTENLHSHAFSNDILRSASQHQPRSAAGRTSPFNSRQLFFSQNKPTPNEFTLPNSPLTKSNLVLSPTQQYQSTRRAGSDAKESTSYANAMKALQSKIKLLEKELSELRTEKNRQTDDYQYNLDVLNAKQMEERNQSEQIESRLKTQLELTEHELREKARFASDVQREIEHLKDQLLNSESDRKKEYQASLSERNQFKVRLSELEHMAEAERRRIKEAQVEEEHLLKERDHLRNQVERLQEKSMKLDKETREKDINTEWKLNELADKNAHLEKLLKEARLELQKEFESSSQREREFKQRIEELIKEKLELSGQVQDLRSYAKDRDSELASKTEALSRKEREASQLKAQLDSVFKEKEKTRLLSDVTQNYAHDVASTNERLLTTLMESTKNKGSGNQNFAFSDQKPDVTSQHPYYSPDTMHVSDLDYRGQQAYQNRGRLGGSTAKFNNSNLRTGGYSQSPNSKVSKHVGFSTHSKQASNPIELRHDYAIPTDRSQTESIDRFSFSAKRPILNNNSHSSARRYGETDQAHGGPTDNRKSGNEIEYENVIKMIVNVEKELLDLTKEYQIHNSDLLVINPLHSCLI